jgi:hypothetical protein
MTKTVTASAAGSDKSFCSLKRLPGGVYLLIHHLLPLSSIIRNQRYIQGEKAITRTAAKSSSRQRLNNGY